jgi:5'-phosphate synthase pdxT subunit
VSQPQTFPPVIGVLALQGDVVEHERVLAALGAVVRRVRRRDDLDAVDALILPGGESTTLGMLLESGGLFEPLQARLAAGMPALGTCAGMILLAREVLDGRPDQRPLGAIDIAVRRNAFGRQLESFEADVPIDGLGAAAIHAVFIRAPIVASYGDQVQVLATVEAPDHERRAVVCRERRVTVAAFHPELSGDTRLHRLLLEDAAMARAEQVG